MGRLGLESLLTCRAGEYPGLENIQGKYLTVVGDFFELQLRLTFWGILTVYIRDCKYFTIFWTGDVKRVFTSQKTPITHLLDS